MRKASNGASRGHGKDFQASLRGLSGCSGVFARVKGLVTHVYKVEKLACAQIRRLQERLGVIYERMARAEDAGDGDRQLIALDEARRDLRDALAALDEWKLKLADAAQATKRGAGA